MNQEQFEKHLRSQITPHKTAIDTNDLWQHIEPELSPEKKKRRFLWLLFPLIGLFGLTYWLSTDAETKVVPSKNVPIPPVVAQQSPSKHNLATASNNTITSNKTPIKDFKNQSPANTKSEENKLISKQSPIKKTVFNQEQKSILKELKTKRYTGKNSQAVNANSTLLSNGLLEVEDTKNMLASNKTMEWQAIPYWWNLLSATQPLLSIKEEIVDTNKTGKSYVVQQAKFSIIANGGIAMPFRRLSTSNEINTNLIDARLASEKTAWSPSYNILGKIQFPKHKIYLQTGLSYTKLNTIFEYSTQSTSQEWDTEAISSIEVMNSDSTVFRFGNWQTVFTNRHIKHHNSFQFIEVPLIIGKSFALTPKWELELETGFGFNLQFTKQGQFIAYYGSAPNIRPYGDDDYISKAGWNWIGGMYCNYQLSDKLFLKGGLAYKNYLFNFIRTDNQIVDKYSLLGINLGIQYRL